MIRATSMLVLAAFGFGGFGCASSQSAIASSTELSQATLHGDVSTCSGFSGQLHGESSCARYDRALGAVRSLELRVMPGPATNSVQCGADLRLTTGRLHVDCTQKDARVLVALTVVEDRFHPEFEGTKHTLGAYTGRYDYVNVLVSDRGNFVDFTVDYGLLD